MTDLHTNEWQLKKIKLNIHCLSSSSLKLKSITKMMHQCQHHLRNLFDLSYSDDFQWITNFVSCLLYSMENFEQHEVKKNNKKTEFIFLGELFLWIAKSMFLGLQTSMIRVQNPISFSFILFSKVRVSRGYNDNFNAIWGSHLARGRQH